MNWNEFLHNSFCYWNNDNEYIIEHKDNSEIYCIIETEHFFSPGVVGWWFREYEGLPKPTKKEAEFAFNVLDEFITPEDSDGIEEMSDYEFYKMTFGR